MKRDFCGLSSYILELYSISITSYDKDITMKAQNLILSLLAAAVIVSAPAAVMAADTEQPARPCPQHMIGCEHGTPHKDCPALAQKAELTEEQKAEMKAKCEALKAEREKKRAEFAKKAAERKAQREKLVKEHHAAVMPLHKQLVQKQMELDALSPNPNVKPEELKALVAEILSLREQIRTMKDDFRKEMGKLGGKRSKRFHGPEHGFRGECGPRPFHGEHGWHNDCAPRCPRGEGWHDGPRRHPGPRHGGCEVMR